MTAPSSRSDGSSGPRTFAFADVWEMAADLVPDREALVIVGPEGDPGTGRRTYAQIEQRANELANTFLAWGIQPGDAVAVYLENRPEYMETMLAAFKVRAVPINVNYRYVEGELAYLLDNCGAVAVVHEPHFSERLASVRTNVPSIRHTIEAGDWYGTASAERPVIERSGDDHYILYTGGTTGMPKGVVWRQEDAFYACIGGGDPMRLLGAVETPDQLPERIMEYTAFQVAPFMHAAGAWVALGWFFAGCRTVLPRGPLDPELIWDTVDAEQTNGLTVIGDAVGRPLLDAWDANPGRWQATSLFSISNGGAPMSPTLKARFAATFPEKVLVDGFGSSEAGVQGSARTSGADVGSTPGIARFQSADGTTVVLDDDDRPLAPGDERAGRVAKTGRLPLGYLGDAEKTAATFLTIDGARWLLTGDLARVAEDGTIELLGRDSATINTGGEKVHAEEVEAVLKGHPTVDDVIVVGVPDERWGSSVCAVVSPLHGTPTLDALVEHCRPHLAGYKLPRHLVVVDKVERSPAGKADLRWAKAVAEAATSR